MRHKPDAAELFEQFLADSRADDALFKVVFVRSDEGGEFRGGKLGTCVDHEESSRNSLRPTVLNLIEQQSTR